MKRRTKGKGLKIALVLVLLALAGGLGGLVLKVQREADREVIAEAGSSANAEKPPETLQLGDEEVPLRKHISTMLVIGKDDIEGKAGPQPEDGLYYNFDLADFMAVLVFDDDAKTVTPIQINRDTMAEVPWLTINGKVGGYQKQQITYAHTYGSGGVDSAKNCARTVSRFLYGAPVEDYISFTMDAIPILNDLVGGVTVTLTEDLPAFGESALAGTKLELKGQNALKFVRYREHEPTDANLPRMNRHRQYLNAFIPAARDTVAKNQDFVLDAFKLLDPYLCMNMTIQDISEYVEKLCSYEILEAVTYEGEYLLGQYAEFYPDEESLYACIRQAYCQS